MARIICATFLKIIPLALIIAMAGIVSSPVTATENVSVSIADFFGEIIFKEPIAREQFLERQMGTMVFGKAVFKSAGEYPRHERKFRIVAAPPEESINAVYYIFTNNKNFFRRLKAESVFDFRGKLTLATPTNANWDEFIFDIVLDE